MVAIAAVVFLFAALLAIDALHVWEPAVHPAKLLHVHKTFPLFIRLTYVWLVVSCVLTALAVLYDQAGGIWGASRHALTVGFVAGMVFVIGQRILPPSAVCACYGARGSCSGRCCCCMLAARCV